jgi:DNA-binding Lrp family transcriptional regulator
MAEHPPKELTLYVQSRKVVTSFYRPPPEPGGVLPDATRVGGGQFGELPGDEGSAPAAEEYFLSDEQARIAALVEEIARRRQHVVRIVDVARRNPLERLLTERLKGVEHLPVLLGAGGHRLEGPDAFTPEAIAAMMPSEHPLRRAYTYVKVRGGDLEPIRAALLAFPEVREVHVLTGDWDLFVALEFPAAPAGKRSVLEFVTQKIRTIPEVLDTSTLVPEVSTTKLPF